MSTVRKVSTVMTSVVFLDDTKTRCIVDDVVYKREIRGRSRSAYMKAYRKRRSGKMATQSPPHDVVNTVRVQHEQHT
jgi:uridine kinase